MKKILAAAALLFASVTAKADVNWFWSSPWDLQQSTVSVTDKDVKIYGSSGTFTVSSTATFNGAVVISTNGITWPDGTVQVSSPTAGGGGSGDAVLSSTQTWTGGNTFNSWSVFSGSITATNSSNTFGGDGNALTNVSTTSLNASGTADGTTFLRGDNTWATPAGSGDVVLASTQTHTGAKTFNSYTVFSGSVTAENSEFSIGSSTFVVTGGDVLIGTTTADANYFVHIVRPSGKANLKLGSNSTSSYPEINFDANGTPIGTIKGTGANTLIVNGASRLNLQSGGSDAIYIDASQLVGIGTTAPGSQLEIKSNSDPTAYVLNISSQNGTTDGFAIRGDGQWVIVGTTYTWPTSGIGYGKQLTASSNVGGTYDLDWELPGLGGYYSLETPGVTYYPIDLDGSLSPNASWGSINWQSLSSPVGSLYMNIGAAGTSENLGWYFNDGVTGSTMAYIGSYNEKRVGIGSSVDVGAHFAVIASTTNNYSLYLGTSTTDIDFVVSTNGLVGIGKSNPSTTLDVNGTATATLFSGNGVLLTGISTQSFNASGTPSATTFLRGDNTWAAPAGSGDVILASTQTHTGAKTFNSYTVFTGSVTAQNSEFSVGGSTFVITGGNVGIGTTNPTSIVAIRKDQNAATTINLTNNTSGTDAYAFWSINSNSADGALLVASDAFTTIPELADDFALYTSGASALSLMHASATGIINFYVGGTTSGDKQVTIDKSSMTVHGKTVFESDVTLPNQDFGDFSVSAGVATLDANTVDVNELADATLDALSAYNTNGLVTQTAADTFTGRTITGPAAGISVADGNGVSGNPTLSLANDLSAVEGLSSTGLATRTGTDAWTVRTITAGSNGGLTVTNGNGVSGNPTISLNTSGALSGDYNLAADAGRFGTSGFIFEGSSADTIETYIAITNPTSSDKTITIPNNTGTVLLDANIGSTVQAYDADLDDLADGSLTGSKVGSGVPAANIAAGSLGSSVIASSIAVAAVGIPNLSASGTPSGTTFLRGDNTWAAPAGSGDAVLSATQTWTGGNTFNSWSVFSGSITATNANNTLGGNGSALTSLTAANISAGTLGASVIASSVAVGGFYSNATVRSNLGLAIGTNVQAWDADLDDLADGSLTGSKVGSGVPAANIAAGSLGGSVIASSIAVSAVGIANLSATGSPSATTFLRGDNTWATPSGSATSTRTYVFDAIALQALNTNFGVLESTASGSVSYMVRAFDDTTREYANGFFTVPSNLDTSGTITIRLNGRPKTAASANTAWTLEHLPLTDSESIAGTYLFSESGDLAVDSTQGDLDQLSWTMSVSSSTWAANDAVFFRLSRNPSAGSDLTGDYYLKGISIDVPIK